MDDFGLGALASFVPGLLSAIPSVISTVSNLFGGGSKAESTAREIEKPNPRIDRLVDLMEE